jgi:hypothetical protein
LKSLEPAISDGTTLFDRMSTLTEYFPEVVQNAKIVIEENRIEPATNSEHATIFRNRSPSVEIIEPVN